MSMIKRGRVEVLSAGYGQDEMKHFVDCLSRQVGNPAVFVRRRV